MVVSFDLSIWNRSRMPITAYQAKYCARDLTRRVPAGIDRLSIALFDAAVDLNPHQIEAALFALQSPLSHGVILEDEVGLGKTIEAGIVLCQFWAERKRRLLVLCPASLHKQWALELAGKCNLPAVVLDRKACAAARREDRDPFAPDAVVIISFNFANALRKDLKKVAWNLVVIDEAHKLRNAYRPSNRIGQGIRWATEGCRKLLLTATPLQYSLLELYMMYQNQDGVHVNGPGRFLTARNIRGGSEDDFFALNADDGARGKVSEFHDEGPWINEGDITDVYVDGLIWHDSIQGVRMLSREARIDRVVIRNVVGVNSDFGFLIETFARPAPPRQLQLAGGQAAARRRSRRHGREDALKGSRPMTSARSTFNSEFCK